MKDDKKNPQLNDDKSSKEGLKKDSEGQQKGKEKELDKGSDKKKSGGCCGA